MLASLQACHHMAGPWSSTLAAAASRAAAAVQAQLPNLWATLHTCSCCCDSSAVTSTSGRNVTSRKSSKRVSRSAGSPQLDQLQSVIASHMQQVPRAARTGDKELLTDAQQESLAIFRRFNISQPQLRGQVILAKVLRATPKHLLVDPGYYGINVVPRQDLASSARYDEKGNQLPISNTIQLGEYVKLRLSAFDTPYGDAQLDPVGIPKDVRQKLVWEELEHRMKRGEPVKGRILNATAGGYAVGVAGYVALLQRQQASIDRTRRIGVLQEFYIHSMDSRNWRINLSNMARRDSDSMKEVWVAAMS